MKPLITGHFIRKHHGSAFQDTPLKGELDAVHVIEHWNEKLSQGTVHLVATGDVGSDDGAKQAG